ncbi:DNA primase, partial [Enterococcus faecium]
WRQRTLAVLIPVSASGKLIAAHEKAAEIYHHMLLHTKAGLPALEYLQSRGLSLVLIEEFNIGFAPNVRSFLQQVFKN